MAKQNSSLISSFSKSTDKIVNKKVSRRDFLKGLTAFMATLSFGGLFIGEKFKIKEKTKVVEKNATKGYGGTPYGV